MVTFVNWKSVRATCGFLILAAGAIAGGCTSTEVIEAEFPYPDEVSFCHALAEMQCTDSLVSTCYDSSSVSLVGDRSRCIEAGGQTLRCNSQGLPYHPEQAEFILAPINALYIDGQLDADESEQLEHLLGKVFYKGGAAGAACEVSSDCTPAEGIVCITKQQKGTCALPVEVARGSQCGNIGENCDDESFCAPLQNGGLVCIERPQINESCVGGQVCAAGLKCGASEVCKALLPNGSECTLSDQCSGGFCTKTSGGDTLSGRCGAIDSFASTSQSCDRFRR